MQLPRSFQIRLHGRSGQGVVATGKLLALAARGRGRHAQAAPAFGVEPIGEPIVSSCRFSERPIRNKAPVTDPDALIVLDPSLIDQVDVFAGLGDDGYLLLNGGLGSGELELGEGAGRLRPDQSLSVPASEISNRHLGKPLPGPALLGGFAALTGQLQLEAVREAVRERFPGATGGACANAAAECFYLVKQMLEVPAGA